MSKNELKRFREILTAKIAELERLDRHRDGIAVERSADELDEIQAASQRALAVCDLNRAFNQLRDAREALLRIQEGSFGACQNCDQDINPKRLAAVPWAQFCIGCQEAMDRNAEKAEGPGDDLFKAA